ncbi:hypothetical protein HDE_10721 [Halotydeus destructor]|nr:hypothetical protein HDE_10721 [Halotydeus destructor]
MILANGSSAINKLTPKELFDCELGVVQSEDGDNPSRMSCVSSASRSRANSCSVQDTCRITASVAANLNVSGVRREDRTAVTEREALSQ